MPCASRRSARRQACIRQSSARISAATVGSVALLNPDFQNAGSPIGVWALNAGPKDSEIKTVKWSDKADKTNKGKWPPKKGQVFAGIDDLLIEIL